jgi:hypothetical protein
VHFFSTTSILAIFPRPGNSRVAFHGGIERSLAREARPSIGRRLQQMVAPTPTFGMLSAIVATFPQTFRDRQRLGIVFPRSPWNNALGCPFHPLIGTITLLAERITRFTTKQDP